ncbi:MAG: succinylglutamate desuccinylase/aspartoacylase family protein [Pseudomonadales bacterium]|nr:succinylglutamate desuccinylase/aspartoacylase family protein [Pseudomonadales bacterium]
MLCLNAPTWASETEDEVLVSPIEAAHPIKKPQPELMGPIQPVPEKQLAKPISILGESVMPGTSQALNWRPVTSLGGLDSPNRVLVVHGTEPGPTFCMTAAIHGDEINGIEIVRRVIHNVEPTKLKGTLIGVPIVNLDGFRRSSRYLSDRRDLNRHFPGNPKGSAASRLAYSLFHDVIAHCDYLIDLHTGSFHRMNLPQLRADLSREDVHKFTKSFGGITVLKSEGSMGTLRRAAMDAGIPAVTLEAGGPMHLNKAVVDYGTKAIENALHTLDMLKLMRFWLTPKPTYYQSTWIRSESSGILISVVELGDKVKKLDVLGEVIDPISNHVDEIRAPFDGQILGMALDQFVSPGFAIYRIGIEAEEEEMGQLQKEIRKEQSPHIPVDIDPSPVHEEE